MIKSIIFDFGNVIATFDNQIFIQYLVPHTDKNAVELTDLIYPKSSQGLTIPKQYETGLITSGKFYEQIKKLVGSDISEKDFSEIYTSDKFWPIPSTIGIIRNLKENGYKVGLLSNTSELDYELGMQPIFRRAKINFDSKSLSFEVGEMKPGKKLYMHALEQLALPVEQCVYIDDVKDYVTQAEKLGMHGIHYAHGKDNLADKLNDVLKGGKMKWQ